MAARLGSDHHNARLTPDLVREARRLKAEGYSYTQVQEALGWPVEMMALRSAINRKTWRHVE